MKRMLAFRLFAAAGVVFGLCGRAQAQPSGEPPHRNEDPIGARLFPPELIMSHQQELGIDDKQRTAMLKEIQKTQAQILPLQWQLQSATEQLAKLLDAAPADEAKVLAQADRVMSAEREVKRAHLGLLLRLRNLLRPDQRAQLGALRARGGPP